MARPHYISTRRKFDPCEQDWVTLAQALVWLAYPNDPGRVRDAAPERARLHRRAQPWEEWTPELDAALTRLMPRHPEKGLLETLRIHARQGDKQVLWTNASLIRIKLRAGNWFMWLTDILTMDPPITLDVADLVETFPELRRQSRPVERALPPTARPTPPRPIKPPLSPLVKRSLPSPVKRLPQSPRESSAAPVLHRRAQKVRQVAPPSVDRPRRRGQRSSPHTVEKLVAFAKKKWPEHVPGRPVTGPALEAEFGEPVARADYRAIMNEVLPSKERKGGRPKNPAK